MTIQDIYDILNAYAPFSLQEGYDRSGFLAGDPQQTVHKIMLTLDITIPVVQEAVEKGVDLILSHHPVIWDPLRTVTPAHPVWHLVRNGIGAICSHTCLDIAKGGVNDYMGEKMQTVLQFADGMEPFVQLDRDRTLGRKAQLAQSLNGRQLAEDLKTAFSCAALRYYCPDDRLIRRIAWCSGSGGDLLGEAQAAGVDALVTGDCKHSVWVDAHNRCFPLFDCGHFETEVLVVQLFTDILHRAAPEVELIASETGNRPYFSVV